MLLAIDAGNTNTTVGLFDGEALAAHWRIGTVARRTADEYAALIFALFAERGLELAEADSVAICSVVPAAVESLVGFAKIHLGVASPLVLTPEMDLGVRVNYHPVTDVGADRICNAVAAHAKYGGKAIVVDLGTATTLDAVSADGEYLGGAIAPGIQIALDALVANAARLTGVELAAPEKAIGDTTARSLQSGVVFGSAGLVDALVERFQKEMGGGVKVIATGGLCELVTACSRTIEHCDQLLTLEGLRIIYERKKPAV